MNNQSIFSQAFNAIKQDYTQIKLYDAIINKEFLLKCINEINWKVVYHTSYKIGEDIELCKAIIAQDYQTLGDMSDNFRNNEEIVEFAIAQDWMAIKYMGNSIKNDHVFIKKLIENSNPSIILKYAGKNIRNNADFMCEHIKKNSSIYFLIGKELEKNEAFLEKILSFQPDLFTVLIADYRFNHRIVLAAVKNRGHNLKYTMHLKDNYDIVIAAIDDNWRALEFASERLKNDQKIVAHALLKNENAIQFVGEDIKKKLISYMI